MMALAACSGSDGGGTAASTSAAATSSGATGDTSTGGTTDGSGEASTTTGAPTTGGPGGTGTATEGSSGTTGSSSGTTSGKVRALDATGAELWITAQVLGCVQPTITDLDGDGNAEVLVTGGVLDGATGALEAPLKAGNEAHAADINVDGELDIVHPVGVFNAGGGVMAETGLEGRFAAVADLDLDGYPEIAVIANGGALLKHHLYIWRYDPMQPKGALIVRAPIDINGALSPALCPAGSAGNTVGGDRQLRLRF